MKNAASAVVFCLALGLGSFVCHAQIDSINIADFDGLPGDGLADQPTLNAAPAFNAALAYAKLNKVRLIRLNKGGYFFTSAPSVIDFDITIAGHGQGRTYLYRHYSSNDGFITITGSARATIRDLGIVSGASYTGGNAIKLLATSSTAPDFSRFIDLYISCNGTNNWNVTVLLDGSARVSQPIGIRDVEFRGCSIFGASVAALQLEQAVSFNFISGGIFSAGGSSGRVMISTASNLPSYYVNIDTTYVGGMAVQNSRYGNFKGYFTSPITTSSNSDYNTVIGTVKSYIQPYWYHATHVGYIEP